MTFFGKGKVNILGADGVSKAFMLGMVHVKQPLETTRKVIEVFCQSIADDPFFNQIPSIKKRVEDGGLYLHANADPPELRYKFFELLSKQIDFSLQAVVGRKDIGRFTTKHNSQEREFYADLLSHLLKDKANYDKLVINIAQRGSSTRIVNLEEALLKAQERHLKRNTGTDYRAEIQFNVQRYTEEPLLAVVDYGLWAIQRIFEKGETRFYDLVRDKLPLIIDLYDAENYQKFRNYYGPSHTLTKENKL